MPSKAPRPKTTKTSSCLCNAVSLEVTGADLGAVACHCSNCQMASGSAFAHNYRLLEAELKVTAGKDLIREYADKATKSGNVLYRHFCTECGSPLYLTSSALAGLVVLHAGSMQDRTQPSVEFYGENKHQWIGEIKADKAKL